MRYTPAQLNFLEEGFKAMRIPELTSAFNREFNLNKAESQIRSTLKNHRCTCGRSTGSPQPKLLNPEQVAFLKENYSSMTREQVTAALNESFDLDLTVSQIVSFTKNNKIRSGRTGHFESGGASWNKGTKGVMKPNAGSFQKGQIPQNAKPLGSERICSKDGYMLVKVAEPNPYTGADTNYRFKHHLVWEREHGPIPDDRIVSFVDGNKLNCEPSNLMLITRAEALYLNRNGYKETPEEIKPLLASLAKLETKRFNIIRNRAPQRKGAKS